MAIIVLKIKRLFVTLIISKYTLSGEKKKKTKKKDKKTPNQTKQSQHFAALCRHLMTTFCRDKERQSAGY